MRKPSIPCPRAQSLIRKMALWVVTLALFCGALGDLEAESEPESTAAAAASESSSTQLTQDQIASEVLSSMDREASPCDDFYRYACGGWLDQAELPGDQAHVARSFTTVRDRNREWIRQILLEAGKDDSATGRLVGDFYSACMAEEAVEKAGLEPLRPLLKKIASVEDLPALFTLVGELHRLGVAPLFDFYVGPDYRNPSLNIAQLSQGGVALPDPDYYLSQDPDRKSLRQAYVETIAEMFTLLGESSEKATAQASQILAFETRLAEISRSRTELRDIERRYNKFDRQRFETLSKGLPFKAYWPFVASGTDVFKQGINVATPEFFERLGAILASTPIEELRAYLVWTLLDATAEQLPQTFVEANFEFFGARLNGHRELRPRWKRCVRTMENALGDALGELYVARAFAGSSKEVALRMIGDIEAAFDRSLADIPWMDDETRRRARAKLQRVEKKIGYPDAWRDYSSLEVAPTTFFANMLAANAFEFDHQASKIGQPVDPAEWGMNAQTVNAFYRPSANRITFPAGILQPPFFHRDFPAAMNYGAIGAIMGHELTHGFDDQGRKFDPEGTLREWWEPEVSQRFEERAQCVEKSFGEFEVVEGLSLDGKLTLGENIADIGGIKQAFRALQSRRVQDAAPAVPGLSDEQLFFVAYAQVWCVLQTPESLRVRAATGPHSPPSVRVNGALKHVPEFAETFACEAESQMRAKDVCWVW